MVVVMARKEVHLVNAVVVVVHMLWNGQEIGMKNNVVNIIGNIE